MTKLRSALLAILALLAPFATCLPAAAAESPETHKVAATFVANEGILITSSDVRILIDGIFDKSYGSFQVPDAETSPS